MSPSDTITVLVTYLLTSCFEPVTNGTYWRQAFCHVLVSQHPLINTAVFPVFTQDFHAPHDGKTSVTLGLSNNTTAAYRQTRGPSLLVWSTGTGLAHSINFMDSRTDAVIKTTLSRLLLLLLLLILPYYKLLLVAVLVLTTFREKSVNVIQQTWCVSLVRQQLAPTAHI